MQEGKEIFINNNINKNYPVGDKLTDWLDKAGHKAYKHEPTRDCKHKEILKGAIEEGNEEQVGQINY